VKYKWSAAVADILSYVHHVTGVCYSWTQQRPIWPAYVVEACWQWLIHDHYTWQWYQCLQWSVLSVIACCYLWVTMVTQVYRLNIKTQVLSVSCCHCYYINPVDTCWWWLFISNCLFLYICTVSHLCSLCCCVKYLQSIFSVIWGVQLVDSAL